MNDNIQHEYEMIFDALQSKIIQCWTYISKNWSEELFMNQLDKWNEIQKYIFSKVSTILDLPSHLSERTCKTCRTIWNDKSFLKKQCIKLENVFNLGFIDYISITDVCPNCDSFINPFLSNPINEEYVRRYIPKKFHKYILILSHKSYEMGYHKGKLDGIDKAIKDSYEFNISINHNFEEKNITNLGLEPKLEYYSFLDGYKEGYNKYYKNTYKSNRLFMDELKEYINKKNNLITDYYIIKISEKSYDSSDNDDNYDDWLIVE